ncbi:hypothetical protein RRSWK_06010 [Rhodopirellula sp. SWK7]|nr:hypothetical protein RRSWK_06010 [Rhodopirellula sp. SWK7]
MLALFSRQISDATTHTDHSNNTLEVTARCGLRAKSIDATRRPIHSTRPIAC